MVNESCLNPADDEPIYLGIFLCECERLWQLALQDITNVAGTKAHGWFALNNAHLIGLNRDDGRLAFSVHGLREFQGFLDKCLDDL